jgi:alpha-galactosidase
MSSRLKYLALSLILLPLPLMALTNNLALTPPMGWNDWNAYGCGISEFIVTNNAGVMIANGMKAAGYQFVDVDDGWVSSRSAYGVIQPYSISTKFPDGIPWLANYVHGMGLKLGIYTDHGTNTCSSCISGAPPPKDPGSYGYEYVDAMTYGSWHVDYLKEDNCNIPASANAEVDYGKMSAGLLLSGQPIVFCLCGVAGMTGAKAYQSWSPVLGNYWRTTGDIGSSFASMISHIDTDSQTAFAAGPGRWNDPDMLEIGNGEFVTNIAGAQTHFSMWCEMAAPLIAGDDIATMSSQSLTILTNREAIAVDQDPAGEQGVFVGGVKDSAEVWSKPLGYDFTTRAVALLNRSTTSSAVITCNFTNLAFQAGTIATVRDLWGHTNVGTFTNSFTATVAPYATMLLKIVGTPIAPPQPGTNYLSLLQPIYAYTGYGTIVPNENIVGGTISLGGNSLHERHRRQFLFGHRIQSGRGVLAVSGDGWG